MPRVRHPYQFAIRTGPLSHALLASHRPSGERSLDMIAVMGGAGNVGSKVADGLLESGEAIRVLEHTRSLTSLRERGAEVVRGNAMKVEDLVALFQGAASALVLLPDNVTDPQFVENRSAMGRGVRDALRASAVSHIVALSAI